MPAIAGGPPFPVPEGSPYPLDEPQLKKGQNQTQSTSPHQPILKRTVKMNCKKGVVWIYGFHLNHVQTESCQSSDIVFIIYRRSNYIIFLIVVCSYNTNTVMCFCITYFNWDRIPLYFNGSCHTVITLVEITSQPLFNCKQWFISILKHKFWKSAFFLENNV